MTQVFPYLPGLGWPVERSSAQFDTTTQIAMSGKKTTFANRVQGVYEYTLTIDGLDSGGSNAALVNNSWQTLVGFINQCMGSALIFDYFDVDDNLAMTQGFGTGDGVTTAFQLARTIGGWADNIFAPLNSGSPVTVPALLGGTTTATYPKPLIYIAGVLQSSSNYTIGSTGVVTFNSAPASGAALTWTGQFYWPCNFDEDSIAMSKMWLNTWDAKTVKFTTRIF